MSKAREVLGRIKEARGKGKGTTVNVSAWLRRDYTSPSSNSKAKQQKFDRVKGALQDQIAELENVEIGLYPDSIKSSTASLEFYIKISDDHLVSLMNKIISIVKTNTGATHGAVQYKDF